MNFKNELIIFIPSIEDGGVEKNIYLISNYLSKKIKKISLITTSKNKKKNSTQELNTSLLNLTFGVTKIENIKL